MSTNEKMYSSVDGQRDGPTNENVLLISGPTTRRSHIANWLTSGEQIKGIYLCDATVGRDALTRAK